MLYLHHKHFSVLSHDFQHIASWTEFVDSALLCVENQVKELKFHCDVFPKYTEFSQPLSNVNIVFHREQKDIPHHSDVLFFHHNNL